MSNSTSAPLSPRAGLAIAAAVTGVALAIGVTMAASFGWLHAPAAQASVSPITPAVATVSAPLAAPTPGVDSSPSAPLTHVDEIGNVWAWYGSGDWVLVAPVPPAPAPVLAAGRERTGEDREYSYQRSGDRSVLGVVQRAASGAREHRDDD